MGPCGTSCDVCTGARMSETVERALASDKRRSGGGAREAVGEPVRSSNGAHTALAWTGDAADIPLRGTALVRAGRAALIAAGMNPRKARAAKGGLYNVGGWQIIFNTQEGGDHTDHLHVGRRRR